MNKKIILVSILVIASLLIIRFSIPVKKYSNSDFGIDNYISSVDKDNDSIDDQTDILESVKAYIATKPIYKSKYYSTGYPDDSYGVCTDVVANGLLGAGYDLMKLVNEDILANSDKYNIDKPDINIDFRRVRNLIIYFKNNYEALTLDVDDISSWQGGDIGIFKNHVGIISDNRNSKGIPYVIHHYSVFQRNYEEDILESRHDLVGHYRIS